MSAISEIDNETVLLRAESLAAPLLQQGGRYYPFDADNFAEAMQAATDKQMATVAKYTEAGDTVAACAALSLITQEYWKKYVEQMVYDDALNQLEREEQDAPRPCWRF